MEITGFSFEWYGDILKRLHSEGFTPLTIADYLDADDSKGPYAIIRHDVDRLAHRALSMARLEASLGVTATYYFRASTFDPGIIDEMQSLGHEIGYHYEDYARADGDIRHAHNMFATHLKQFREHADIRTVCAHGSPLSPFTNYDMWTEGPSLAAYNLLGEAYLSINKAEEGDESPYYCSDTNREWTVRDAAYDHITSTPDLLAAFSELTTPGVYLLAHPSRWSQTYPQFFTGISMDVGAQLGKDSLMVANRIRAAADSNESVGSLRSRVGTIRDRVPGFR